MGCTPPLPELLCLFHCSAVPEISQILLYGICPSSFEIGILQFTEYLPVFFGKILLGVEPDIFRSGKSAISTLSQYGVLLLPHIVKNPLKSRLDQKKLLCCSSVCSVGCFS